MMVRVTRSVQTLDVFTINQFKSRINKTTGRFHSILYLPFPFLFHFELFRFSFVFVSLDFPVTVSASVNAFFKFPLINVSISANRNYTGTMYCVTCVLPVMMSL